MIAKSLSEFEESAEIEAKIIKATKENFVERRKENHAVE